jgi:hypothetical protein
MRAGAIAALAFVSGLAAAADTAPTWPPSEASRARIAELQAVLASRDATDAERQSAREELSGYLRLGKPPEGKAPARAATSPVPGYIDTPTIGKAFKGSDPPAPQPMTRVAPVPPAPSPIPNPSGGVVTPIPGGAIDPRTGTVYVETPSGYIDPRTGQVVPKR